VSEVRADRPVRLVVTDDLVRSRWTVAFRLILAIPVLVVYALWTLAAIVAAVVAWLVVLARGRLGARLHDFLASYVGFTVRMNAYLHLAADPWPGLGTVLSYPVVVEIDPPTRQRRWTAALRLFLALPALLLAAASGGGGNFGWRSGWGLSGSGGTGATAAFFGWFACLAQGRMPRGLRDLAVYGIGYSAQTLAYLLLLTDRYPNADPALAGPIALPGHPVRLELRDDLARPRLLVLFRLLLALPHLVWITLWTVAAAPVAVASWLTALVRGSLPQALHRFLAAYVRYSLHLGAFVLMVGGPFPGFVGAAGSYPVDVTMPQPERQGRGTIVSRIVLAVPALALAGAYSGLSFVVALLGWFSALARGRMPQGLQRLGAASLRYQAQTWAYVLLLTGRYPYAAPALEDETSAASVPAASTVGGAPEPEAA